VTFLTFADAYDSLFAYLGAAPSDAVVRDIRQSIDEAFRELVNSHNWSYYYKHGRLIVNPPYFAGTIRYQASGGAAPYYVTLTGGTWPAWAADGYLHVNGVALRVDRVLDPTHLTLAYPLVPAADITAGTSYRLYQDSYVLPTDFIAQDQSLYEQTFGALQYVHPRDWLFSHRYVYSAGTPSTYTIMGDEKYPDRLVVRLAPLPADHRSLDFIYKRRPRPVLWGNQPQCSQGTVALSPNSVTVVGTGTGFDPTMAGSVLRVSANSMLPTWMPGSNPAIFEARIDSVQSATQLKLMPLTPSMLSLAAAKYLISDPLDIEVGSMANALLRACEHKISQHRIMKDKPDAKLQFLDELRRAKEADSRSFSGRAEGEVYCHRQRMRDMPLGPDMT
jgi:hypothetical protein